MFRIVTDFVDKPAFSLICDSRNCLCGIQTPADLSSVETLKSGQEAFFTTAQNAGWGIGWDAQLCPGHQKRLLDIAEAAKSKSRNLVQLAPGMTIPRSVLNDRGPANRRY